MDLDRWRAVLGAEHVSAEASRATFATHQQAAAVLRPGSRDEVVACLRLAGELGVRVHPISRGRNWGYGGRVPRVDGAVLLDLGRLDRIVDFDERLAYVTVEPGVSFRQLARYLRAIRARVFASVTGGAAEGSVIANALERGDGAGPNGDRWANIAGLEVVLADGRVIETGFARFGGPTAPLGGWGVGPVVDGLFSQAHAGVVTRATIWLTPFPAQYALGWWRSDDLGVVEPLRDLRLRGIVTGTVSVWNDVKALSLVTRFPWSETAPPLSEAWRQTLRDRFSLSRWNGTVSLYAHSEAHGDALRALVADAVPGITFQDGPADPLDLPEDAVNPALGMPHDRNLASVYWRKRDVPDTLDPDRDRCGFIWVSHAVPFTAGHARVAARLCEDALLDGGFDPNVALLGVTPRLLQLVCAIVYDRDLDGEDARARAAFDHLDAALTAAGYPPFRTGLLSTVPATPGYDELVAAIGRTLDPRGTLS